MQYSVYVLYRELMECIIGDTTIRLSVLNSDKQKSNNVSISPGGYITSTSICFALVTPVAETYQLSTTLCVGWSTVLVVDRIGGMPTK